MVVDAIGGVGARRWVTVGPGVGGCGEGDSMPFGVAAPSAFLSLLRSPLLLLFLFSPPTFGAFSFPTSCCCCLAGSARASQVKVLELIFGSMECYGLVRGKE